MIRLSKLADYGIVIITHLARAGDRQQAAPEVAVATQVPQPTVSKILKHLVRAELLVSHRGAHGGYGLARDPGAISVAEVIEALDGPIALTSCIEPGHAELCGIEDLCPARSNWRKINHAIRHALDGISVAEMAYTIPAAFLSAEERSAAERVGAGRAAGGPVPESMGRSSERQGSDGKNRFGVG
ncbi:SUF system Fe-S cluster assembly regulator [Geminicoccaceae bacterium 1502E]|nr:SUF system Fe-S cluster assembly regulator [Geminicoccaceae bacterium 1502E]